jgi:hypothetical protein
MLAPERTIWELSRDRAGEKDHAVGVLIAKPALGIVAGIVWI